MNGVIITIDSNDALQVGSLNWPGALVSIASLPAGDLKAVCPDGATILIERKTPRDLLDSIKDGRLFNQVAGLVEGADFAYIVVTGTFTENNGYVITHNYPNQDTTNWAWHSLQGALLSIQQLGCAILYDPDYHGAVERIINRSRSDVKIAARRQPYVFSQAENVLMALPGIGSNKALEILEIFGGNVGVALEWLSDPGRFDPRISGIGSKTKEKINDLFGGRLELKL